MTVHSKLQIVAQGFKRIFVHGLLINIYVDHSLLVSVCWGRTWEEPRLPGDVVAMVMVPHLLLKGVSPGPTGAPTEALGGKGVYGKESACSH